jgi:UDP-N-acetylglucosamine diphosphorylase/glucosamine-1-phosphate N-acetyltransferase
MHLCIYEDSGSSSFNPLTYFRPAFDLRCGILTLREKIIRRFKGLPVVLHARQSLHPLLHEGSPEVPIGSVKAESCLFVNGRVLPTAASANLMRKHRGDAIFVHGSTVVGALLSGDRLGAVRAQLAEDAFEPTGGARLPRVDVEALVFQYPWDLLAANVNEIVSDFAALRRSGSRRTSVHPSAVLAGRKQIAIGEGSAIGPGVVIDARNGPVWMGRNVTIMPGAVLEGPCSIGEGSIVRIHAKIYSGTTIGPVCKVGGEIEGSIMLSHSNKQHDGFLGDSYLAMWVNLGAGTTNSNLKNTYGTVRITVNGEEIDTGRMFVGVIAGDHVKTGINSSLNTGTIIGPSSNIFGGGLPPKYIPAFSWGGTQGLVTYDVEKALAVAKTVMGRRGVQITAAYREIFRRVYETTRHERTNAAR